MRKVCYGLRFHNSLSVIHLYHMTCIQASIIFFLHHPVRTEWLPSHLNAFFEPNLNPVFHSKGERAKVRRENKTSLKGFSVL